MIGIEIARAFSDALLAVDPRGKMEADAKDGEPGALRFFRVTSGGPDKPEREGAELSMDSARDGEWCLGLPIGTPGIDGGSGIEPFEPPDPYELCKP